MAMTMEDGRPLVARARLRGWTTTVGRSTLAGVLFWIALQFATGVIGGAGTRFGTRIIDAFWDGVGAIESYIEHATAADALDESLLPVQRLCDAAAYARAGGPENVEKSFEIFRRYHRALSVAERGRLDPRLERTAELMVEAFDTEGAIRTYKALFADLLNGCPGRSPSNI